MKRKPTKITGIAPRPPKQAIKKNNFIRDDAWDENFLVEMGLMQFLDDCGKLSYELKNCVRGSYCLEGSDPKDLLDFLTEMKDSLEEVYTNIEGEIGE